MDKFPGANLFNLLRDHEDDWNEHMINFIIDHIFVHQWRSTNFSNIVKQLYKKRIDQIFSRCVPQHEKLSIMLEAHQAMMGSTLRYN